MLRAIADNILPHLGLTETEQKMARDAFITGGAQAAGTLTVITIATISKTGIGMIAEAFTSRPNQTLCLVGIGVVIANYISQHRTPHDRVNY